MTDRRNERHPLARKDGLLIERLPDEVLVYDLDRNKAHCLNSSAALIWNHCDGKTTVGGILRILQRQAEGKVDADVVWFGLDQLYEARLIQSRVARRGISARMSRREAVKQIGLAISVPLVASILAPTASAALSCIGQVCALGCGVGCHCVLEVCVEN